MTPMLLNNRYRILRKLGSGGFGDTFLAEDTHMPSGRKCVIKQLKPIAKHPAIYQVVQERFQREATVLEDLGEHSHQIPKLYAYFTHNKQFYLVQELIDGQTLRQVVQTAGLLNETAVREILASLLLVLDYVHGKGIVHRDIKPDNIILRQRDGQPVLIDFGAVKETMSATDSQDHTVSSMVLGTPGFMPSEQAAGRPVYSSDLHSLGLTAIYLLTGKTPRQLETDPESGQILWQQEAPNVSPSLVAVLDKAIQLHPTNRYPSAREMLNALQSEAVEIPATIPMAKQPAIPPVAAISEQAMPPTSPPSNQASPQKLILLGSAIAGSLIGASVIIGFALNKQPQTVAQQVSSAPHVAISQPSQPEQLALSDSSEQMFSASTVTSEPESNSHLASLPATPQPSVTPHTPPLLNQVIPTYVPSAFEPNLAFTSCPDNTQILMLGETLNFQFAVCGANQTLQYYVAKQKSTGNEIIAAWNGSEFRQQKTVYVPPNYEEGGNNADAYLRVYEGNQLVLDEKVTQLYQLGKD